eukprot:2952680-Pyramimonas_sp.AAC.1
MHGHAQFKRGGNQCTGTVTSCILEPARERSLQEGSNQCTARSRMQMHFHFTEPEATSIESRRPHLEGMPDRHSQSQFFQRVYI